MSKYVIDSSTLTSIADAVRAKTGSTEPIVVSDIPTAISNISGGGGDLPAETLTISGDCSYRFAYNGWNWFIEEYRNRIATNNISNATHMFYNNTLTEIPFDLNFSPSANFCFLDNLFGFCFSLLKISKLNNVKVYDTSSMFNYCYNLRTIQEDIADTWDWSYLESQTQEYIGKQSGMFDNCTSLRSFPMTLIKSGNPYSNYSNSYFYNGFNNCYALDELINLPIPYTEAEWISEAFNDTFNQCNRLKNITFKTNDDGTGIAVNWKNQFIDLASYVGYAQFIDDILKYNSGITADKEVTNSTTYQVLKNNPDWFTADINYSRYNHDSAVRTINSLPDASAYLASAGGTNTIKFKGASGASTDGGAISNLTETEIAVATAKGWTIVFA